MLESITPIIITFDEAENIGRTLLKLKWARVIIVVDSCSNDKTRDIIAEFPQTKVFHRPFDTLANQWRFAVQETGISTPWILRLDADYLLSDELISEMSELDPDATISAYRVRFDYAIYSKKLSSSLYPPNMVLLRVDKFEIQTQGHTEKWIVNGAVANLKGRITHDDQKPLSRWIASQQRYASLEADYLLASNAVALSKTDRIRRMGWAAPVAVFIYVLVVKRCILDGWAGWYYAFQRLFAETLIALELLDRRLKRNISQRK